MADHSTPGDGQETNPDERDSALENLTAEQLPAADFVTLMTMLTSQAMVALGQIPNPATGRSEPQPALAKYFIDLLAVLEQKTAGNLTDVEQQALEQTIHQARMAYVKLVGE